MILTELFETTRVVNERHKLVFTKHGDSIKKHYRCASGRIVASPGACPSSNKFLKKNKKKLVAKLFKHHIHNIKNRFNNS